MENLAAFNYNLAVYIQQQQQQQRAVAQMALLNRQKSESVQPFSMKKEKLSFGMDTILGTPEPPTPAHIYDPIGPVSPSKLLPFMGFASQKSMYDGHIAAHRQQGLNFRQNGLGRIATVPLPKSKRNRTVFTNDQLERLEHEFVRSKYLVGNERSNLAIELGLNETQVKVWFQNRRIKFRKQTKSGDQKSDSCHDSSHASSESESESIEVIPNN